MTVAVVIPSHPTRTRNGMLDRALASINRQTRLPDQVVIAHDLTGAGSAATRNAGLNGVWADWVALLDSDDELDERHLERLLGHAERTGADLVYPWYRKIGAIDIWEDRRGKTFDERLLRRGNFIAITVLVRSDLIHEVGGFRPDHRVAPGRSACDEWGTWLRLLDAGARFSHLPAVTWTWHCHPGQTQGLPTRGDARSALPDRRPG